MGAAFDWYQATVRVPLNDLLGAFLAHGDRTALEHRRGVQGYETMTKLVGGEGLGEVEVWHGGRHPHPHVRLTSDAAAIYAPALRAAYPVHSPSRIDVKEDFAEPGVFDRVLPELIRIAGDHRVAVDARGDHYLTKEGRTLTLGSATSVVKLRVYDKAAELRSKLASDPIRLLQCPEHLTRFEVQVKPPSDPLIREMMSTSAPEKFLGASGFVRDAWQAFGGEQPEAMNASRPYRASDDDRAYAYLLEAFGKLLTRRKDELGSWACVGQQLGDDLAASSAAKRALAARRRPGA